VIGAALSDMTLPVGLSGLTGGKQLKSTIESTIEESVASSHFKMSVLREAAWPQVEAHEGLSPLVSAVQARLSAGAYLKLQNMILRHVFLIELAKPPNFVTTKFRARWCNELEGDPRGSSYEERLEICRDLLASFPAWFESPQHVETFELFHSCNLLPYEGPLDYGQVPSPWRRWQTSLSRKLSVD
jgi:hypothetical protein